MPWQIQIAKRAQKELEKIPATDQKRILAALTIMGDDPYSGDIARLRSQPATWRRRVGHYRIFFDINHELQIVNVVEIVRRTSKTY